MKNIFSFKMYREGLRRLTLVGSLFLALMMIGAVLIPILVIVGNMPNVDEYCTCCGELLIWSAWRSPPVEVFGIYANITAVIAIALFSPIATLVLFSFLNKRNSSDFFHAIPHKRSTVFVSFLASLVTWIWGAVIVTTAVSVGIFAIGANLGAVTLNVGSILIALLSVMAGSLLMIAVFLIAMSVTGNIFANITMALLIMYLPRAIFIAYTELVSNSIGYIADFIAIPVLSSWRYNIAFSGGYSLLRIAINNENHTRNFMQTGAAHPIGPMIYSFILAMIYLAVGVVLFKRRKSEMAANPAPNKWVQLMNRAAVGFMAMLPAAVLIVLMAADVIIVDSTMVIAVIAIYLVACVAYFGYEFISKKQFTNFFKLLPGLALVLALNFAFTAGAYGTQYVILNRELDADNVRSVQIGQIRGVLEFDDAPFGWDSYETLNLSNFRFEDEALIEILVNTLNDQLRRIRRRQINPNFGSEISVTFNTNLGPVRRNLRISNATSRELSTILRENEDFVCIATTMPTLDSINHITSMQGWNSGGWHDLYRSDSAILGGQMLSQDDFRALYQVLREEMQGLCPFELQENRWSRDSQVTRIMELWVHGRVGRQQFTSSYHITCQTPRAAALAFELVNAHNRAGVLELLEDERNTALSVLFWNNNGASWANEWVWGWNASGYVMTGHAHLMREPVSAAILAQDGIPSNMGHVFEFRIGYFVQESPYHRRTIRQYSFFVDAECEVIFAFFTPATTRS